MARSDPNSRLWLITFSSSSREARVVGWDNGARWAEIELPRTCRRSPATTMSTYPKWSRRCAVGTGTSLFKLAANSTLEIGRRHEDQETKPGSQRLTRGDATRPHRGRSASRQAGSACRSKARLRAELSTSQRPSDPAERTQSAAL